MRKLILAVTSVMMTAGTANAVTVVTNGGVSLSLGAATSSGWSSLGLETAGAASGVLANGASLGLDKAQLVTGSANGQYAAPYSTALGGQIGGQYVTVYNGGTATVQFSLTQAVNKFSVLWGSVDLGHANKVTLTLSDNRSVSFYVEDLRTIDPTINTTGGSVGNLANTNWGPDGSVVANFVSDAAIRSVVFQSGQNSFEFANAKVAAVPLPGALPLFGAALFGLGALARRKRA